MLRVGYAKSVPDEESRRAERDPSPLREATLSHKGRGEVSKASTTIHRGRHLFCHGIRRKKFQRDALDVRSSTLALRDRHQQVAAP